MVKQEGGFFNKLQGFPLRKSKKNKSQIFLLSHKHVFNLKNIVRLIFG